MGDQAPRELTAQELAKIEAETAKLNADQTREQVKFEAEMRKAAAELNKLSAEADKAGSEAESARIDVVKKTRDDAERRVSNKYYHVYRIAESINDKSVTSCMDQLDIWDRIDSNCPVEIVFTSPGGSVVDGLALWDYLAEFRRAGHRLTTHTRGYAASMAGILLQAGEVRAMGKESYLLIHQVQAGMMGSFGELTDRMKWLEMTQERILDIFATRSSAVTGKSFIATRKMIKSNWQRTDWWIPSDEALKLGLVDEVR